MSVAETYLATNLVVPAWIRLSPVSARLRIKARRRRPDGRDSRSGQPADLGEWSMCKPACVAPLVPT
jgi:hypothetical protein